MSSYIIAVDLGGTNIKSAVIDTQGAIHERNVSDTPFDTTPDSVIPQIEDDIKKLQSSMKLESSQIMGIAIGSPGPLNSKEGIIYETPNLEGWDNVPLKTLLSQKTGHQVSLYNDANAAAYGEFWKGSGVGANTFIHFTLGTGVGGGVVINKNLFTGVDDTAGELGHINVEPNGLPCGCGSKGCLETLASATAIVRDVGFAIESGAPSQLTELYKDGKLSAKDVSMAANKRDGLAVNALRKAGQSLGIAVGGLINTLNPEVISFGGGLSMAGDLLLEWVKYEAKKRSFPKPFARANIVVGKLGNEAGFIGAAGLMLKERRDH